MDLAGRLRARGVAARWDDIIRHPESRRLANDRLRLRDFSRDLAAAVSAVLRRGLRPVVVGGDHSYAIATWGAVRQTLPGLLGLVWIDAHMDSHTPETSQSGGVHGMPLAVLLGHQAPELTGLDPPGPKVLPQHLCLLGVRGFEPAEAGAVIPGTGDCRKVRWAAKGKRGGGRVIYCLRPGHEQIVLVAAYGKGERNDVPGTWLKRIKEAFDHEQG